MDVTSSPPRFQTKDKLYLYLLYRKKLSDSQNELALGLTMRWLNIHSLLMWWNWWLHTDSNQENYIHRWMTYRCLPIWTYWRTQTLNTYQQARRRSWKTHQRGSTKELKTVGRQQFWFRTVDKRQAELPDCCKKKNKKQIRSVLAHLTATCSTALFRESALRRRCSNFTMDQRNPVTFQNPVRRKNIS